MPLRMNDIMVTWAGRVLAFAALGAGLMSADASRAEQLPVASISWRVENSFRFFTDAADTEVHRATYLALPPEQRLAHPVLGAEQALSARHDEGRYLLERSHEPL